MNTIKLFEEAIAKFYGAPYAVATDCCTHAIELCLRYKFAQKIKCPVRTYPSVPMLANKLGIKLEWKVENWKNYYIVETGIPFCTIYDAAVFWKKDGYIPGSFMCLSFQFQKHLSLGRGGMILTDDKEAKETLKRMSYDGREPDVPWRQQNIKEMGYHYYMTPETAEMGLKKLKQAKKTPPRQWTIEDWPDLTTMEIFK